MKRSGNATPATIAGIVLLVAAFGLAGCGRKLALDPPPGAAVAPHTVAEEPPAPGTSPDPTGYEKPVAPPTTVRRRLPILDWLVN